MWKTNIQNVTTNSNVLKGKFETTEPLNIVGVDSSCGCTIASFNNSEINYKIELKTPKEQIPKTLYDKGKRDYDKEINLHAKIDNDGKIDYQRLTIKIRVYEHESVKLSD